MTNTTVRVFLENESLWDKFYAVGNEMIVNNKGRKIFPSIKVKITNLQDSRLYSVYINFIKKGSKRFIDGRWNSCRGEEEMSTTEECVTDSYMHPNSPNYGTFWNESVVSFPSLKITNKKGLKKDQIHLDTFCQYVPRLSIFKIRDGSTHEQEFVTHHDFEKASFVAVTTYQSEELINLKVLHNPFAKGFQKRKFTNMIENERPTHANQSYDENSNHPSEVIPYQMEHEFLLKRQAADFNCNDLQPPYDVQCARHEENMRNFAHNSFYNIDHHNGQNFPPHSINHKMQFEDSDEWSRRNYDPCKDHHRGLHFSAIHSYSAPFNGLSYQHFNSQRNEDPYQHFEEFLYPNYH